MVWPHLPFSVCLLKEVIPLHQRSPTFLAPGTGFVEDSFSTGDGGGAGGMVQEVMWAIGSGRWSFTGSPTAHLLLHGLVPNRPWTGTGPWPRGWGPLLYTDPSSFLLSLRILNIPSTLPGMMYFLLLTWVILIPLLCTQLRCCFLWNLSCPLPTLSRIFPYYNT